MNRLYILFITSLLSIIGYSQNGPDLAFYNVGNIGGTVTVIANADDGSGRLFLGTKGGKVFIMDQGGTINMDEPFLDLTNRTPTLFSGGEGGLLGLAFHPNYNDPVTPNQTIYVYYTGTGITSYISKFTVNENAGSISNYIDETQEVNLINFPQPQGNHNGGSVQFGKDGYLYIASGDGGKQTDPDENAQNINTYLGKILRIDVDGNNKGDYGVPASNPYVGIDGLDENWVIGLRNPWRTSFDSSGDFWIGDVGQGSKEEITLLKYNDGDADWNDGANLGWNCFEGFENTTYNNDCPSGLTDPAFDYDRADNGDGASVTGGFLYEGSSSPTMEGYYFFADFVDNVIYAMKKSDAENATANSTTVEEYTNTGVFNITTFGVNEGKEIYIGDAGGGIHLMIEEGALPVGLVRFSGKLNNNKKVELDWQIEDAINVSNYEIERSEDGREFAKIDHSMAEVAKKNYRFIDEKPLVGLNFYRLKVNDVDGSFSYSNIVKIQIESKEQVNIFPNPNTGQFTVQLDGFSNSEYELELRIFNNLGEIVFQELATKVSYPWQKEVVLPDLPVGIYTVELIIGEEIKLAQLVIE